MSWFRETLTKSSVDKDLEQLDISYMLLGVWTGTDILENGLAFALKLNIFTVSPEILILGLHAKEMSTRLYKRQVYTIIS